MTGAEVPLEVRAVFEHRKARSACCSAGLDPGPHLGMWQCKTCGQPCSRVLGEPTEIVVTNG